MSLLLQSSIHPSTIRFITSFLFSRSVHFVADCNATYLRKKMKKIQEDFNKRCKRRSPLHTRTSQVMLSYVFGSLQTRSNCDTQL